MLNRLDMVLNKLEDGGMKIGLEKCKFSRSSVKYLGHVISQQGIKPDPEKIEAIQKIPEPKNLKQVKSFLGLPSYYRKFI
jgi:hypothetical protein